MHITLLSISHLSTWLPVLYLFLIYWTHIDPEGSEIMIIIYMQNYEHHTKCVKSIIMLGMLSIIYCIFLSLDKSYITFYCMLWSKYTYIYRGARIFKPYMKAVIELILLDHTICKQILLYEYIAYFSLFWKI